MISVVLLTRNGGAVLREAISMLATQNVAHEVEIVAVDSGSTDGTVEYMKANGVRVHRIPGSCFSFGATRDLACSLSKGRVLVVQSQDVVPRDSDYLARLCRPLLDGTADIVQGKTGSTLNARVFVWHRDSKAFYFTSEGTLFRRDAFGIMLSCECMAIARNVWERTRFGTAPYCEDKALQVRAQALGARIVKVWEPLAWHDHSFDMLRLVRRCHNEGVGWRHVGVKYTLRACLRDIMRGHRTYGIQLFRGLVNGTLGTSAEVLFFAIRPLGLLLGNRLRHRVWQ